MFVKSSYFLAFMAFILIGCGEKPPQGLRAEFRENIESMLSVMATMMGGNKRLSQPMIQCMSEKMTNMFSDEEIRLMTNASFSERMDSSNTGKFIRIQRKMESEEIRDMTYLQCAKEMNKN